MKAHKFVFIVVIQILYELPLVIACVDIHEIFFKLPWLVSEFQEISLFSDTPFLACSNEYFTKNGTTLSEASFFSLPTKDAFEMKTNNSSSSSSLTAMIINPSKNFTDYEEILQSLQNVLTSSTSQEFLATSFIFIVWPAVLYEMDSISTAFPEDHFISLWKNQNFSLPFDSNVFIIMPNEKRLYTLWESYSVKGIEVVQDIDANISQPYFLWELIKFKSNRRSDFRGVSIIATGVDDPIYEAEVSFIKHGNGTGDLKDGMAVSLYRILKDLHNFRENAIIAGYIGEEATSPGILGMETYLERGDADIAITESGVNKNNAGAVTLLHATTTLWLEARFSTLPKSKWNFFLSPFHDIIWYLIISHLLLIISCIFLFRNAANGGETYEQKNVESCIQLDFLWALGTLCQQGWYIFPNKTSIRLLFLVASVTGFLLNAAYSATITSKLSLKDASFSFEKLVNDSYIFYMESDLNFPVDPEKYDDKIKLTTVSNLVDSMPAVVNLPKSKSVLISFSEFFYALVHHAGYTDAEACSRFTVIRVSKMPQLCSMAVKHGSPFKEIFNINILFMMERGINNRLMGEYLKQTRFSCQDNIVVSTQSIEELFVAFLIITVGLVASAIICFFEILYEFLMDPGGPGITSHDLRCPQ